MLIKWDRESGESVVSWQAREPWDALKGEVKDEDDALRLSRLLRINQHHFLAAVAWVAGAGAVDAVFGLLSPDYAENRYRFVGLDALTLTFERMVPTPRQDTYRRSKSARAVRIAFDALNAYGAGGTRNVQVVNEEVLASQIAVIEASLQDLLALPFDVQDRAQCRLSWSWCWA